MAGKLHAPFPFVAAPDLELIDGVEEIWPRILSDVASARHRVWLENYIFEDGLAADALLEAFAEASAHGASIRVIADAAGSFKMSRTLRRRLEELGVELRIYNPIRLVPALRHGLSRVLSRTHRRILVIDEHTAWTGGWAICDRWWPQPYRTPIKDSMLRICGPLVSQLAISFDLMWQRDFSLPRVPHQTGDLDQARVIVQFPSTGLHFRNDLYRRMARTRERLWLCTPYFIPSVKFRRTLRKACRRGVDVRLLLPGPNSHDHPAVRYAGQRYYTRLLVSKARIFEYQPAFLHAKMALFDDEWTALGSANLDRWSFFLNHEIMVAARHHCLAEQVNRSFRRAFLDSDEVTLAKWRARSRWNRIKERFFGFFDRVF